MNIKPLDRRPQLLLDALSSPVNSLVGGGCQIEEAILVLGRHVEGLQGEEERRLAAEAVDQVLAQSIVDKRSWLGL